MKLDPTDISTIMAFCGTTFAVLYLLRTGRLAQLAIYTSLGISLAANFLFAGLSNTTIGEFMARSAATFAILKATGWLVAYIEGTPTGFTPAARQYATSQYSTNQTIEDIEFEEVNQ